MRKTLALIVSAGLATAALSAPALAGQQKKIEDTITVTAAPLPNYSSHTATEQPGCMAGEEGIHKVTTPLHIPGAGKLSTDLKGFTGDWDLYVLNKKGRILGESVNDQTAGAAMEEAISLKFKKMADIAIVACNWAGTPEAQLHYKVLYTATSGGHHH